MFKIQTMKQRKYSGTPKNRKGPKIYGQRTFSDKVSLTEQDRILQKRYDKLKKEGKLS